MAVFALVLVGFALSLSDVSADGSDYQVVVNGQAETNTVEAVIGSATGVVTIELTGDISVGYLNVPNGAEVIIDGKDHIMTLTAHNVTGKIHFMNVTMVAADEEGILFGIGNTDVITLTNVVVKDKAVFYKGAFETNDCTFEKRLQLQTSGNPKCKIQDTVIEDLQFNSQGETELILCGTEGQDVNVVLSGSTTMNKMTAREGAAKTTIKGLDIQVTELLIESRSELVIGQGSTIETTGESKNNGTITNNGAFVVKGNFNNNGAYGGSGETIQASGANITGVSGVTITTGESESTDSLGLKNYLDNNYTISKKAFLAGDLTVREGVTLTIASTGSLNLNDFRLILEGNLVVANGGTISAANVTTATSNSIQIMKTGTITNDGIIGKGDAAVMVTVGSDRDYDGVGSVQMKNVTGVSFGLTKVVDDGVDYVLTVSGTVYKKSTDHVLAINGAYVSDLNIRDVTAATVTDSSVVKNSTFDIGSKAKVRVNNLILRTGATFDIDGVLKGNTVSMESGAVAVIDGEASGVSFSAKTGEYPTYTGDKRTDIGTYSGEGVSTSSVKLINLSGITVEVTSKAYADDNNVPMTKQMLNVYGAASFSEDAEVPANTTGSIAITEDVYVPASKELVLAKTGMSVSGGRFIIEGTIKTISGITTYRGASYELKDAATETVYNYYTTFDNAYAAIADADDKTITVMGGYTFEKEYAIAAEQQIVLTSGSYEVFDKGKISIANDGTLSINDGITLSVEGVLVVMSEGSCNGTIAYEVKSTDAEGTVTYSGAVWAIENASEGSTVNIVNNVTFNKKVTVPEGVTVKVNSEKTVTASKGITVNGTILNEGIIGIKADESLEVAGKIDSTVGSIDCVGGTGQYKVTVTGTVLGALTNAKVNAASYQADTTVYTSVINAVSAVSEMDIPVEIKVSGKFTEASDITLGEDMIITIEADADITLNSIRLPVGSTLTVNGKLTADVIGAVGKADTTGAVSDAVIDLSKAKNVVFKLTYSESDAASTLTLTINADYAGAVKVEKGTVAVNTGGMELSASAATFAIGSDATVDLNSASTITNKDKAFTNEGTLNINENVTFIGVLGGDVIVKADKTITLKTTENVPANTETETEAIEGISTIVIGTITLSEKDGTSASAKIVGEVLIGTAPETLGASGAVSGKVSFDAGTAENPVESYVIVFEGSTFASTENGVKSTSYTVNDIEFARIYTDNGSVTIDVIDDYVRGLDDLETEDEDGDPIDIEWFSNGMTVLGTTPVISVGAVETTIDYKSATVAVSEGPGLQVYIDDIRTDGSEELAIGTHTITVYLLPNYEGTPVITINGTTITDGTFEITTDMINGQNKIVVTGATYVEPSTPSIVIPSQPAESDDDMGLTEYLLIVLVILAAILVIVVAIRMMRS